MWVVDEDVVVLPTHWLLNKRLVDAHTCTHETKGRGGGGRSVASIAATSSTVEAGQGEGTLGDHLQTTLLHSCSPAHEQRKSSTAAVLRAAAESETR